MATKRTYVTISLTADQHVSLMYELEQILAWLPDEEEYAERITAVEEILKECEV